MKRATFTEFPVVFHLRIPESLDEKIRLAARTRDVSINAEINERLRKTFEEQGEVSVCG